MTQLTPDLNQLSQQMKNNWSWFASIGAVLIIIGILALCYQFIATIFSIYFIGILLLIAGITQAIHSLRIRGFGQTASWAIMGVLYIIAGIISFIKPIEASSAITLLLSFLLIASGIAQAIGAINNKGFPYWGWWLFSGIITFLLGMLIMIGWPANSLFILGMFLGIDLVFQGWAYLAIGLALKSIKNE